ncbi:MAG: amidohydrolase [Frankiaceae bacterium]
MTDRTSTLYRNGQVHAPAVPGASALLVVGDRIAWIGREDDAARHADGAAEVVDLDGAWLAPAFVDAHVHATSNGLALTGLDLSATDSLDDALDRLARHAADDEGGVVLGTGWDETRWPERRPPSPAELERAAPGRLVYLSRIDVHSAVASLALLETAPSARDATGWDETGWLRRDAHHVVRRAAHALITPAQRRAAQRATLARAAALGIGCVHECAGPDISGTDDCAALLELAATEPGPVVVPYWGELADLGGLDRARELGAAGAAGDLFVDGAIGSRTACLSGEYADDPGNRGALYHDAAAVGRHVAACTAAGMQAGFHAIGDAAIEMVLDGFRRAAEQAGLDAVRAMRHRIEHVEMPPDVALLARYGIVASVQPAFDALWGGPDGMYAARLGTARGTTLNPYAAMVAAGVPLALGSDAPITPLDPWGGVRAAASHRTPPSSITAELAFAAHTVGGWRAARIDDAGELAPGAAATFAAWRVAALDPATGLPDLDAPDPACLRTVVAGRAV